ncbi:hypothetical protein K6025_05065 [Ehrlichia sp. JZT12]
MSNLAWVLYRSMRKELNNVVKHLYNDACALLSNNSSYCPEFDIPHRALIMLFNIACNLLRHPELKESAPLCTSIVFRMENRGCEVLTRYIDLHNAAFVYYDPEMLRLLLNDVRKEIFAESKGVKVLYSKLIRTSNFISPSFLLVAIVTTFIENFFNQMQGSTVINVERKQTHGGNNSIGIVSNAFIQWKGLYSMSILPDFSPEDYIHKMKCCIDGLTEVYNKFLLEDLQKRYKCSFEDVLYCIAEASLASPNGDAFSGEAQLLLCNGSIKMVSNFSVGRPSKKKKTAAVKGVNSQIAEMSDSIASSSSCSAIQSSYNESIVPVEKVNSEVVQNNDSVDLSLGSGPSVSSVVDPLCCVGEVASANRNDLSGNSFVQ